MSWVVVDGAGWSWVEVDGAAWSWVHGLVIPFHFALFRSSRSQIFFKISFFQNYRNIHQKAPALKSLF